MIKDIKPGDSNRITREYFDSLLIEMRHIDNVKPSAEITLYGEKFATPIMTAALSHLDKSYPDGAKLMAKGAFDAGAIEWTGMGGETELENIISTGARTIKIIKPNIDNLVIFKKIEHAEKSGAFAVGMDLDHSFNKHGEYDNVLGEQQSPKSIDELKSFVKATNLPFIIKGVLSVTDAKKCVDAGIRGILVSHHHGIMDYAVPPLMVLPDIVDAVAGEIPIFVDCGIESGYDAFKALALGADAVCAGRILMDHLKKDGAPGVTDKLDTMKLELLGIMARTGFGSVADIDSSVLWQR